MIALAGVLACVLAWLLARSWPAPPVERATLASVAFVPLWSGLALAGLAWSRRARPGHARRSLFALHRRMGGGLAVVAMLLFGSGVGAVLDRALASWQVRAEPTEVAPASEQALDQALAELLRLHPELGQADIALHPAGPDHPWIQADFFDRDRKPVRVDLDPQTGAVLARGQGPLWVLREFHRRLLLQPVLGESVLGVLGLCLALVLLSGLATRRWLRSRSTASKQPTTMRAHQWLGLGLLPAAIVWTWTGALLGLTLIIVPIVGGAAYGGDRTKLMHDVLAVDRPPLDERSVTTPALRELVSRGCPTIHEQLPELEVHRVVIHHPTQASGTVRVDLEGPGLLTRASFTVGADGSLRDCRALPSAGVGLESFMASIALHYGEWEGRWFPRVLVDVVYLVLGSGLLALAWLGGCLLARRRERDGDAVGALRLRRWLTSVGLGMCLITVGLAMLSRVPALARNDSAALLLSAATVVAVVLWTFTGELERRRRALALALAVGLLAIPVVGWLLASAVPGGIEAVAVVVAAGLLVAARRRFPEHASVG